jgi:hypothetical protein
MGAGKYPNGQTRTGPSWEFSIQAFRPSSRQRLQPVPHESLVERVERAGRGARSGLNSRTGVADLLPETMYGQNKLRRSPRMALDNRIRVSHQNSAGEDCCVWGRCLDIAKHGLRFEVPIAIPVRSYVCFHVHGLDFQGSGSVRFCDRRGLNYIVGLEFSGALQWHGNSPVRQSSTAHSIPSSAPAS